MSKSTEAFLNEEYTELPCLPNGANHNSKKRRWGGKQIEQILLIIILTITNSCQILRMFNDHLFLCRTCLIIVKDAKILLAYGLLLRIIIFYLS